MSNEDIENRKNRNVGRPKIEDKSKIRDKKVMLSFTQEEYDELVKMQKLLNRSTLTSTLNYFIDRGREAVEKDFSRNR